MVYIIKTNQSNHPSMARDEDGDDQDEDKDKDKDEDRRGGEGKGGTGVHSPRPFRSQNPCSSGLQSA